jgi:8-amino-7-oxononanoate synthase
MLSPSGLASRLLRGHHDIWDEVEARLANWHGCEAVLMMTSGYTANEGLISTLCEPGDWVASDELNHACIIDGLRLARCRKFSYRHNDLNHLEEGLQAEANRSETGRVRFVITESVFSMDGDRAPLREIADLCQKYGANLIVDEAHSTGCYGDTGSGCVDHDGLRNRVLATIHTGGKALGVFGAYIAGSRLLKDYLINKCRHLIFTTALPAECGRWWLEMLPKVSTDQDGREALHTGARLCRDELTRHGIPTLGSEYIVPVVIGDDPTAVRVAAAIRDAGFDVRAIRPPSVPPGTARVRVSIHADHTAEQLRELAAAFRQALP